jgi:hypothetical protein
MTAEIDAADVAGIDDRTALHEAAHALTAYLMGHELSSVRVEGPGRGVCWHRLRGRSSIALRPRCATSIGTPADSVIAVAMAGFVAESRADEEERVKRFTLEQAMLSGDDIVQARRLALLLEHGDEEAAQRRMNRAGDETAVLLFECPRHRRALGHLADALIAHGELSGHAATRVIRKALSANVRQAIRERDRDHAATRRFVGAVT